MNRLAFDTATRRDPLDAAILMAEAPDRLRGLLRDELIEGNTRDLEWWGPPGDPGEPPPVKEDADGVFVSLAGQRIPAELDGEIVRVGIPGRVGFCTAWALVACERLLVHGAATIALVFGRVVGTAQQTWAEFEEGGRSFVLDLTLSEQRFARDAYMDAAHALAGTRIPISDQTTVDRFREASKESDPWDQDRATFLDRIAPVSRQKE